jgi:hypothetical protein
MAFIIVAAALVEKVGETVNRIPRPKGEGAAKRRVRGEEKKEGANNLQQLNIYFTPHPAR